MKVSENWLREWVNPELSIEELASLLTMSGLEVDAINPVAGCFDKVIVAQIIHTKSHPQADKLSLCDIDIGADNLLRVVCGAANVRPGLKVAFAQIGATLPGDLTIKEAKLRGEISFGMLCSAAELGLLDSSEGILELNKDAPIGIDLRDYLLLDDYALDIELTPNRADCLSVIGIAREIAALTNSTLKSLPIANVKPQVTTKKIIKLAAPEACPQYCGRIIHGINSHATTPLWMQERLRRSGLRSIHPVVDVTNYVMLELGQPMHAFDLEKLKGDIVVRYSNDNELITLLDGRQVTLQKNILLIADEQQPLAIAGIMGGELSAVSDNTLDIFLESAFFNPQIIAKTARSLSIFTDSAQRFERGVDPSLQVKALERATALLLDIVGGQAGPILLEKEVQLLPIKQPIPFNYKKVKQLTGLDIPKAAIITMLSSLDMTLDTTDDVLWQVTAPTYRFDIQLDVDLVEEIVRLHGYDKIPGQSMIAKIEPGVINPIDVLLTKFNHFFTARTYFETISYSFVDPELQKILCSDIAALTLLNPISSELSQMRVSLWPGLIASLIHNVHRQQTSIKFFESGVIFNLEDGEVCEETCFSGLLCGDYAPLSWIGEQRKFDFFDAKGDLEALFELLQLNDVNFCKGEHPALHPGKAAEITWQNQAIGWCGVLHPRLADALDLTDEIVLFELKLTALKEESLIRYQKISKYPQIRRDLSFLVNEDIAIQQIEHAIKKAVKPELLKSFNVFDVYTGNHVPPGKKSLAIAIILQDISRTLIDKEINEIISAIIDILHKEFAITLRE